MVFAKLNENKKEELKNMVVAYTKKWGRKNQLQAVTLHSACIVSMEDIPLLANHFPNTFQYINDRDKDKRMLKVLS